MVSPKCATAGAEAAEESQLPLTPEQALRVGNVNWRKRRRRNLVELKQVRSPRLFRKAVKRTVYSTNLLNNPFQPYKLFAQTGGGCTNTEHHFTGACLDLAHPTRGRILAAFTCSFLTDAACRWQKKRAIDFLSLYYGRQV